MYYWQAARIFLYSWWKMATFGKLTEYDPEQEEWGSYIEHLEFFFTANDIEDAEKKESYIVELKWIKDIQVILCPNSTCKAW